MAASAPGVRPGIVAEQLERYEFSVRFPETAFPPLRVDEPPPVGADKGPNPVRVLAAAVGHCMSSTLFNCLERAHVTVGTIRTTVRAEVARNEKGRQRVRRLSISIAAAPVNESDRERFQHCVEIFEDFCTVSGAVREGIVLATEVIPPDGSPERPYAP